MNTIKIPLPDARKQAIDNLNKFSNRAIPPKVELPSPRKEEVAAVNNMSQQWAIGGFVYAIKNQIARDLANPTLDEIKTRAQKLGTTYGKPWRPPQWKDLPKDQMSELVFLKTNMSIAYEDGSIYGYFFDAVLSEDHVNDREITRHPVQTGAPITDHSYQQPTTVTLEIGMSDAMDSLATNQYSASGISTKSIEAYRAFKALQEGGQPLTLQTRLYRYENMLIKSVRAKDDKTTTHALKATIILQEIKLAQTSIIKTSLLPAQSGAVAKKVVKVDKDNKAYDVLSTIRIFEDGGVTQPNQGNLLQAITTTNQRAGIGVVQ